VGFATVQRLQGLGIKVGEGTTVAWERVASPALFRQQLQSAAAEKARKAGA
jgi:trehalose 6-phosphate phosphatase